MRVAELWRYPVKSMAGERLDAADVGRDGIAGDRVVHVAGPRGGVISARTHPRLLAFHAVLGPDGEPVVEGRPWTDPLLAEEVEAATMPGARLVRYDGRERFDVLPLLIATDGALAAMGVDHRRFRPNLVVAGVPGLDERTWPGRRLRVGSVLIEVVKLRRRCVMTTYDPDTQAQDVSVLRRIAQEFDGRLALDSDVLEPGKIAVGDAVELD